MDYFEEMMKNEYPDTPDTVRETVLKTVKENMEGKRLRTKRTMRSYVVKAVAAAIALMLLLPGAVYAAREFRWPDSELGSPSSKQSMVRKMRKEGKVFEAEGFRFKIERAFSDKEMGTAYCYISVTDTSGKGRNPKDYYEGCDDHIKAEDVIYKFRVRAGDNRGTYAESCEYDEKNSTKQTAYYYIRFARPNQGIVETMNRIDISFARIRGIEPTKVDGYEGKEIDLEELEGGGTLEITNVIKMPAARWTKKGKQQYMKIAITPVTARISGMEKPVESFSAVSKTGKKLWEYKEKNKDKPQENINDVFESRTNYDITVFYDNIDLDGVKGAYVNGEYFPVKKARVER